MNLEQPAIARHHDALLVPLRHTLDARTQWVELLDAQLAAPSLGPEGQMRRRWNSPSKMVDFTILIITIQHSRVVISPIKTCHQHLSFKHRNFTINMLEYAQQIGI